MIERRIFGPDEIIEEEEAGPEEIARRLQQLQPGEFWSKQFPARDQLMNPNHMVGFINKLREAGLDIGKGSANFGFKMPLPEGRISTRELQIFRRS